MTLSERNTFFKVVIIFCSVITLLLIGVSLLTIPLYSTMEEISRQPQNLIQLLTGFFLKTNYIAVHASIAVAVLFSLLTLILIHHYFERTSAPEILYISFFTVSLAFEAIRLIVPLHLLFNFPMFYLESAARILFFARHFSLFSLLAASVCSAGLEIQRIRTIILVLLIATLIMTLGVPIDGQIWDTCFNMIYGYRPMFTMVEIIVIIATVISFFVAIKHRRSNDYLYVGIGVAIALTGRRVLLGTDNWIGPVTGVLLLAFGTWIMCTKLHRIHLWL